MSIPYFATVVCPHSSTHGDTTLLTRSGVPWFRSIYHSRKMSSIPGIEANAVSIPSTSRTTLEASVYVRAMFKQMASTSSSATSVNLESFYHAIATPRAASRLKSARPSQSALKSSSFSMSNHLRSPHFTVVTQMEQKNMSLRFDCFFCPINGPQPPGRLFLRTREFPFPRSGRPLLFRGHPLPKFPEDKFLVFHFRRALISESLFFLSSIPSHPPNFGISTLPLKFVLPELGLPINQAAFLPSSTTRWFLSGSSSSANYSATNCLSVA